MITPELPKFHYAVSDKEIGTDSDLSDKGGEDEGEFGFRQTTQL